MSDVEHEEPLRARARAGGLDPLRQAEQVPVPGKQTGTAGLGDGRNGPYATPTLGAGGRFYAGPDGGSHQQASNAGGETRDVAHPTDVGIHPDVDTKYTIRRKSEQRIHVGPLPATLQLRWEFSLKGKGDVRRGIPGVPSKKGSVALGSNQALIEKSEKGLNAKISTALVSATFDLLSEGKLPVPLDALVPKVELKGLDVALAADGPDLKAMSLALVIDDEFTQFLDESVRSVLEVRGQVRLECAVDPELVKHIIEMSRHANDVARGLAVESKIAKTEQRIAYWKRFRHKDKVAKLEKELSALRKVRDKVGAAKDLALRKLEQVGLELEKTAAGRLVKKVGSKALSLVFKKFVPIFNVISTAQDVYEVVNYLRGLDWKSIGDRIANGGGGGTTISDASHDGEAGGGAGFGEGGTGDANDIDADSVERELQQEENVELSAAAQAVVGVVEAKSGDGGTHLSKEDKETLNHVVPADLGPEEVEAIKTRISTSTGSQQSLVTSVIAAVQQVRPFGEKRPGPDTSPSSESEVRAAKPSSTKSDSARANTKQKTASSGTWIVDPVETLQRVIKVDVLGNATTPAVVRFPGFEARVTIRNKARLSFDTGEAGSETSYMINVDITPDTEPAGIFMRIGRDIRALKAGEPVRNVTVVVTATRSGS